MIDYGLMIHKLKNTLSRIKSYIIKYFKQMDKDANTRPKRIAFYLYLAGWVIWIVQWPIRGLTGLILVWVSLALWVPFMMISFRDLRRHMRVLKQELRRLEIKIIVHETLFEISNPKEYERMIKAREVNKLFKKK